MPQPTGVYVRSQGTVAAIINAVVNPVLAWLGNPEMEFVPLSEGIIDTAVTSVVLSLLVALFITFGVHRDLEAGRIMITKGFSHEGRLLSRLPSKAWILGLMLGLVIVVVLIPLTFVLFFFMGISGLSFGAFALFKAGYTAILAFIVTRWVILRQLPLV